MKPEHRLYDVIQSDIYRDYPVHIGWCYSMAVELREDRKREYPAFDFWIRPTKP